MTSRCRILAKLNVAEAFETFPMQTKFVGQKRFSLEGGEALIPLLDVVLSEAAEAGLDDEPWSRLGAPRQAQRARRHHRRVLRARSSRSSRATSTKSTQGSGDVKYHCRRSRRLHRREQ